LNNEKRDAILLRRIGASLIDYFIIFLFTFLYIDEFGNPEEASLIIDPLIALGIPTFWFIYLPIAEGILSATVGHYVMGIVVLTDEKEEISMKQAFTRRIADTFELVPCLGSIAYFVAKGNPKGKRIGDKWAGTRVLYKKGNEDKVEFPI